MNLGEWRAESADRFRLEPDLSTSESFSDELHPTDLGLVNWISPAIEPWDESLQEPLFLHYRPEVIPRLRLGRKSDSEGMPRVVGRRFKYVHDFAEFEEATIENVRHQEDMDDDRIRSAEWREYEMDAQVLVVFKLNWLLDRQRDEAHRELRKLRELYRHIHRDKHRPKQGNRENRFSEMLKVFDLANTGLSYETVSEAASIDIDTFNKRLAAARKLINGGWRHLPRLKPW